MIQGEKNYTDNLKEQAFQNYDTVRRNLEKQNKILNKEINALMGGDPVYDHDIQPSSNYKKDRPFNPLGWGSDPNSLESKKLAEYRKQGLKLIDDVATRSKNTNDPSSLDFRLDTNQGGLSTTDEGEIIMNTETELIPVKYKQVDRKALSKFDNLDQEDIVKAVKKEAKQERITDQIKYQTHEERLEDLKRRNLDFDTLMNEMVKECRHIYEDEVGITPIKRGEGPDTLDQIIENLYNDDFKVKNLPPKTKATSTEATSGHQNGPQNQKSGFSHDIPHTKPEDKRGIMTEKFKIKVNDSPENLFDSFGGNDSGHMDKKSPPNPFLMDSYAEENHENGAHSSKREPHFALNSPPNNSTHNSSVLSPDKTSPFGVKGPHESDNSSAHFGNTGVSGQHSFGNTHEDTKKPTAEDKPKGLVSTLTQKPTEPEKKPHEKDEKEDSGDEAMPEEDEKGEEEEADNEEGNEEGNEEEIDGDEEYQENSNIEEGDEESGREESLKEDHKESNRSKNSKEDQIKSSERGKTEKGGSNQPNTAPGKQDDIKKSDSKKKVTFSEEVDKQEF